MPLHGTVMDRAAEIDLAMNCSTAPSPTSRRRVCSSEATPKSCSGRSSKYNSNHLAVLDEPLCDVFHAFLLPEFDGRTHEQQATAWRKAMRGTAISSWAMLTTFCGTPVRSARREVGVGALVGDFSSKA